MFKKSHAKETLKNTVIDENSIIEAIKISCGGSLRIDGKITGDIHAVSVIIGEKAFVKGNIVCKNIYSSGIIEGEVDAAEELHLGQSSVLKGNICASSVIIDEGAIFCGNCSIREKNLPLPDDDEGYILTEQEIDKAV